MSKAILILDNMPKECLDCEILNGYDNSCVGGKIGYDAIYEDRIKPKWCPLKPLGRKVEEYGLETWNTRDGIFLFEKGLFDEIYGDEEE